MRLDRTLPAKLAPPRSPEGTAVVLIIDKSSSMEGKKIELARLAAIGVVDNLRPIDMVGVLIFDNSFQWAVPMRKAEDRSLIKRLISGIVPDGGTQIAPALAEAYRQVLPSRATFKHIVLLTDGISEEGDSLDLSKEALAQHVTISTVGLGQDVNRAYLEKVAALAGGKSYFLNEPAGLEQILLKDVMEHTGIYGRREDVACPSSPRTWRSSMAWASTPRQRSKAISGSSPSHVGHDSQDRSERSAAGAMAVRPGPGGGVHIRRQEPLGRRLGDLERLRQILDQRFPGSAAARRGGRGSSRIR